MLAFLILLTGCADTSWDEARRSDTVAAYHQFLRDHADSSYAAEAQERVDYLRVRTHQTIESFEAFEQGYPQSALLEELRAFVEPLYFEAARTANSIEAYQKFLRRYPSGEMSTRALGNLVYVETVRESPTDDVLQDFVDNHRDSDFFTEARRGIDLREMRTRGDIHWLPVRVNVAANVKQAERVRRGFAAVVARRYRELGIQVSMTPPNENTPENATAWMDIDYHEAPAEGTLGTGTLVSQARVRLYHRGTEKPIWDHTFEAPADHILQGASGRDRTVFGNSRYRFWDEFFVPVSTWPAAETRIKQLEYIDDVIAVDVRGDRAALLYERGGIDYMDISDPLEPTVVDRYRRDHDLARWSGVKLLTDSLIIIYGQDGAEIVEIGEYQIERIASWELPDIGSVSDAATYGKTLLIAGSKGVHAVRLHQRPLLPHRLMEGEYVGLAVVEPHIYLISPFTVEVATPEELLSHVSGARTTLGKNFGARRARLAAGSLWIFGKEEVAEVSLASAERPQVVSNLPTDRVGMVTDLVADFDHLYLVGERGLQVTNMSGQAVEDSVQIIGSSSIARKDRFVFLAGNRTLEVLDLAPYYRGAAALEKP